MTLGNIYTVRMADGRIVTDAPAEWIAKGRRGVAAVEPCLKWRAGAGHKVAVVYTTCNTAVTLARLDSVADAARMIETLREWEPEKLEALLDRFDPLWIFRGELVRGA